MDALIEPVFNTFVISIDGLRPENVDPTLMPNLSALLAEPCEPGGTCATQYEQARAMMVTETNGNHVAMMTGAYGGDSGVFANESFDRVTGQALDLDSPSLNLAQTLFDRIENRKPWLDTALVMGKDKLTNLFGCTRPDGEDACGPSSANPEGKVVDHVAPDRIAGATGSPADPEVDCPAEPGSGSGYSTNQCTMDAALRLLTTEDPDFSFINLPEVDAMSHLFGADSPQAQAAVVSADAQLGRLVAQLRASNKWQHSIVVVTADHNFGATAAPQNRVFLDGVLDGSGSAPFQVVTHGGSASVFLTDLKDPAAPLTAEQQATLAEMRTRALATDGVTAALYRRPNPVDGGASHTIDNVRPEWRLGATGRVGELLITADETHLVLATQQDDDTVVLGQHGHPTDRHIPFIVPDTPARL